MGLSSSPNAPLDEALVRELLAEQFPQLKSERIARIGEGGRRTYEIDGTLIVRFATDEPGAVKMRREVALLPAIGDSLPLPVPAIELIGQPGKRYPYPFVGYRKLRGLSGEDVRPESHHWRDIAVQFGEFLSALHTFPVERAKAYGVPEAPNEAFGAEYRTKNAAELLRRVQEFAPVIRKKLPDLIDREMARYLSGRVRRLPRSPLPTVLCHADMKGEHIIVSEQADAVVGIIDWADCCITDPLLDFTGLMIWLGEGFVRQVLERYTCAVDEHFMERVCFYARCFTLDNLGWQLTTDWSAPLELLKTQTRWAFER